MRKMKMTSVGDVILIQHLQEGGYRGMKEITDYIAKGDARFANLEECLTEWDTWPSRFSGGTWMNAEPSVLSDILSFGFNFLGFSNNHCLDMGQEGLLETVDCVRAENIAITGAGMDMTEAAAPVYRTFDGGRVAFIAVTSSFHDSDLAGYATKTMLGRPGVNGLRISTRYSVTKEHMDTLRAIAKNTKMNGARDISIRDGFVKPDPEGTFVFNGMTFVETKNKKEERFASCNKNDLRRIGNAIRDAKMLADYVVVMYHAHGIRGDKMNEPDQAAEEFGRFCIDNGVSAVFGGGTHQLKPLEIYKGKPIFYSLGNFCFQNNLVERQPYDMFETFGLSEELSDIQGLARRQGDYKIGLQSQAENFRTVIPYLEFDGEKLTKLEMKPVELGFKKSHTEKGIPYAAKGKEAQTIFETLSKLSAPYGTKLKMRKDGIIEATL